MNADEAEAMMEADPAVGLDAGGMVVDMRNRRGEKPVRRRRKRRLLPKPGYQRMLKRGDVVAGKRNSWVPSVQVLMRLMEIRHRMRSRAKASSPELVIAAIRGELEEAEAGGWEPDKGKEPVTEETAATEPGAAGPEKPADNGVQGNGSDRSDLDVALELRERLKRMLDEVDEKGRPVLCAADRAKFMADLMRFYGLAQAKPVDTGKGSDEEDRRVVVVMRKF